MANIYLLCLIILRIHTMVGDVVATSVNHYSIINVDADKHLVHPSSILTCLGIK